MQLLLCQVEPGNVTRPTTSMMNNGNRQEPGCRSRLLCQAGGRGQRGAHLGQRTAADLHDRPSATCRKGVTQSKCRRSHHAGGKARVDGWGPTLPNGVLPPESTRCQVTLAVQMPPSLLSS